MILFFYSITHQNCDLISFKLKFDILFSRPGRGLTLKDRDSDLPLTAPVFIEAVNARHTVCCVFVRGKIRSASSSYVDSSV